MDAIIRPLKLISRLSQEEPRYARVKQSTQFVVGASDETDREIVDYSWGLYRRLQMNRVYFSAYQRGLGASDLPGEQSDLSDSQMLTREHRLYQVDFLMRKYGFRADEIPFETGGSLESLHIRARTGASVLVVERGEQSFPGPAPDFELQPSDRLLIFGSLDAAGRLHQLLRERSGNGADAT